jgi:hypothetical protein
MKTEELLKKRFKLLAKYPGSTLPVGSVFRSDINYFENFPANFQLLQWYEDRSDEDMPTFIKYGNNGKVRMVKRYFYWHSGEVFAHFEGGRERRLKPEWNPATEEDFLKQEANSQIELPKPVK